jgi:hypothetical protein
MRGRCLVWTPSKVSVGVGVVAAAITAFAITRRVALRARRRAAFAAAMHSERWVGIEDDFEPDQLDSEDLQWRPRIGSSLAGPEDLEEPLELDFSEFDETDLASAAITVDMTGGETEQDATAVGRGGGEPERRAEGKRRRSSTERQTDDTDWLDELDDPSQPPHRYR